MMEQGYRKVYALKGGWRAWIDANYPIEEKDDDEDDEEEDDDDETSGKKK